MMNRHTGSRALIAAAALLAATIAGKTSLSASTSPAPFRTCRTRQGRLNSRSCATATTT